MALFNVPIVALLSVQKREHVFLTGGVEYAEEDRNIENRSLVL